MAKGHGGARRGSGRKPYRPDLIRQSVRLTDEQVKLLRKWGRGDMAAGLRWLIDMAALWMVHQAESDPPHNSG